MKIGIVLVLLLFSNALFPSDGETDALISRFDYTASEKKTLSAIFEDARDKGIDTTELAPVLREQLLKKSSYYETVEALARRQKEIDIVRNSPFPHLDQPKVRTVAYYLVRLYSVRQYQVLSEDFRQAKLTPDRIEALFQFNLSILSYEITAGDAFALMHALLASGQHDQPSLDAIRGLYVRSRDLKLDRKQITRRLTGDLGRGKEVKKIVFEIKAAGPKR